MRGKLGKKEREAELAHRRKRAKDMQGSPVAADKAPLKAILMAVGKRLPGRPGRPKKVEA